MTPVRAEAVRTLYLQMRGSAVSAVIVGLYMTGTAAAYTPWPLVLGWALALAVTQVGRELLIRAWRRRRVDDDARLDPWAHAYTLYMVITGALWGSTIFLFAHLDQPITVALTLCGLFGVAGGSVPANAYNPPGLYALVGFMFAPVVARLLAVGTFQYVLLGIACGLFAVIMVRFCRVQARTLDDGFQIRFEKAALLEEVTAQKAEVEEAWRHADEARRKAELASLAKSQFLAAASHDLRQPLYALSLFSASLGELRLDADGRAVVGKIQESIGAMESLFDGLLDLSKLEAGVVKPRLAPTSVDALFDRISQYFRPVALDRGLDLRFRSNGEWVVSDAVLLEQVLGNLVANGLRCTEKGGVLVAARAGRAGVRLEVWDTGVGIPKADLERIFDEFVQLGNAERDRRKGLGLGLSIAKRSGALIGARIDVASRPGLGSRFGFIQPAASAAGPAAFPNSPARVTPLPDLKRRGNLPLLVIDDDRDVRTALADLLHRWGVPFDAAADAEAALRLIGEGARYGMVLADYRLTGPVDGLELIAAILARHPPPAPAVALITADMDPGLVAAARARGVPVIPKPLRPAQLRELIGVGERA